MKYKHKWKLKKLWYRILAILTILSICVIGLLQEKLVETILSIVLFFTFSSLYEKQYHSRSLYKCSLISIIVFTIQSRVNLDFVTSIFCTIVLTFIVTYISYCVRDLFDKVLLVELYKQKLEQYEHKCIENLSEIELQSRLPDIPYDIIHIVHGYIHKPKNLNASGYAMRCHISEATLYRYLKRVKTEYENLG